jgi:hypothetical protein
MRWYKTVARIFLILSVVDFTFAGLAQFRAMLDAQADCMKMAQDIMKASEKRHKPLDELSERSAKRSTVGHAHSRDVSDGSEDSVTGPKVETPPGSVTDEESKFFNEEWKGDTVETLVFTVALGAVTSLASQFYPSQLHDGITYPSPCVFSYFLPLLPTL